MTAERILRAAALLIAVLAFADPALTRAALSRPTVIVLQASAADRSLAARAAAAVATRFDVSRVDRPGAAAYVLVGSDLPEGWRPPADAKVFAVVPGADDPVVQIRQLTIPTEVSVDSVASAVADLHVSGTGDRDVTVALVADGVRLRQVTQRVSGADTRVQVPITFVPTQAGVVRLRVEAAATGREPAVADTVVNITTRVWRVLAFDGRPSYPATFVRRALEADPRFSVTTRVVTSRASAIQTNSAPSSLSDWQSLAAFDLVIIGAPEVLGASEADALERYMRERNGAVILLPETTQGPLLAKLTGQPGWVEDRRVVPVPVSPAAAGNETWAAAEFVWPARWPSLTAPLATPGAGGPGAEVRHAVWQIPVGAGRLVVSSAVDGWRSRAGAASGFSAFWRTTAAAAAQATPPAVDIRLRERLLTPGQWVDVAVGMFSGGEPSTRLTGPFTGGPTIRLWPSEPTSTGAGREWLGSFRAPDEPGRYSLEVTSSSGPSGRAEFLVAAPDGADEPVRPSAERDGLSELAAAAHGGRVVPATELVTLPAQVAEVVNSSPAREVWHPMRSVWWLVPFTLCAAGEWWLRRRRGER